MSKTTAVKSKSPAEVKIKLPEPLVETVRLPDATDRFDAPVPSIEKAPEESTSKVPVISISRFAPALRSISPAEVAMSEPEVEVERVRLFPVTLKDEAPLEARVRAPAAALPIEIVPVDVPVLMLVAKFEELLRLTAAPVIVSPPVP